MPHSPPNLFGGGGLLHRDKIPAPQHRPVPRTRSRPSAADGTRRDEGGVELYPCGDQICGRFYWMKDDTENGDLSRDKNNPDSAQRERPLCHMQFMGSFTPERRESLHRRLDLQSARRWHLQRANDAHRSRHARTARLSIYSRSSAKARPGSAPTSMPACLSD